MAVSDLLNRAAARDDRREVADAEELHRHVECAEAQLVAVVNLRAARERLAIQGDADFGVELADAEVSVLPREFSTCT